ncbi:ankyrin repeat domain-containing protein [bacterium]|nr:ankyrin repeat domain-containing protein [bacterium]
MKHLLLTTIAAVLLVGCNGQFVDRSLVEASEKGDLSKVQQLLDSGADPNVEDYANHTALYYAAEKGHFNIAKLLLEKGAKVDHESGDSALLWACHYGHVDIVKLLIENGADVNAKRSMDDSTPLCFAAHRNHKEIVELLLEKGADANVANQHGETALDLSKPETVAILRKHGGKTGEDLGAKPWNWKEMETVARELLGTYECKHENEQLGFKTGQIILFREGIAQYKVGDTKFPEEKWKLKYQYEVHVTNSKGETDVFTVMDDKQSLLKVGRIIDNHRKGLIRQTFRKLK